VGSLYRVVLNRPAFYNLWVVLRLILLVLLTNVMIEFHTDEQKPYRLGYPNQQDDPHESDMLRFYRGEIPSKPQGMHVNRT
jgi:hypothetical protein